MTLSIVIVSYQVRHFLDLCLRSVARAMEGIETEVWVVDNASTDGTVDYVRAQHPWVKVIANTDNPGFSKANNQAIVQCTGEYVLILNPDTVLAEDTLTACIAFMQAHPDAGALGVRMVDGTGVFLPESKRALPTPMVAFYKIFGLSALFPRSKTFGQYHLGYLPEMENHAVAVLSGAFMFFRKSALDKVGLFDESFFMYGEDIDLSYRTTLAGYTNYYIADTTIIHYKGESTKKGSLNYVRVFYQAMVIFYQKHFGAQYARAFGLLVQIAVALRALMAVAARVLASAYLFAIDAIFGFIGIYSLIQYWASTVKNAPQYYPMQFITIVVPTYIAVWITAAYYSSGYEKPFRITDSLRGIAVGTIIIAAIYGFLPEHWRFSRSVIVLGAVVMGVVMALTRILYNLIRHRQLNFTEPHAIRVLTVGNQEAAQRVSNILLHSHSGYEPVYTLPPTTDAPTVHRYADTFQAREIILSDSTLTYRQIITLMSQLGESFQFKIYNQPTQSLIGSNSKNTTGELLAADTRYRLATPIARHQKRLLDLICCLILIPLLPIAWIIVKNRIGLISNWSAVLIGQKTWVGYIPTQMPFILPSIPPAILYASIGTTTTLDTAAIAQVNRLYARDYSVIADLYMICKNVKWLGS